MIDGFRGRLISAEQADHDIAVQSGTAPVWLAAPALHESFIHNTLSV